MTDETKDRKPGEGRKPDDLLSVQEIAAELDVAESTVWLLTKRYDLPRFRMPGRGKTSLFRWEDVWRSYTTPLPVPRHQSRGKGKAAA